MLNYRRERASSFILQELTLLVRNQVADPAVQALTITDVQLTRDRRIARVYVATYSGEDDLREGIKGLVRAKGFLRHGLSQVLHWQFTPQLDFREDRSWEHGARIDEILAEIDQERSERIDEDESPE